MDQKSHILYINEFKIDQTLKCKSFSEKKKKYFRYQVR